MHPDSNRRRQGFNPGIIDARKTSGYRSSAFKSEGISHYLRAELIISLDDPTLLPPRRKALLSYHYCDIRPVSYAAPSSAGLMRTPEKPGSVHHAGYAPIMPEATPLPANLGIKLLRTLTIKKWLTARLTMSF